MDEQMLLLMTATIIDELHPDEIILFGSRARGSQRDQSDVDLLIIVPDSEEAKRHRRRLEGRVYRRLAHFRVPKDILILTRHEVQRWRNVVGHIVESSLREGLRYMPDNTLAKQMLDAAITDLKALGL